MQKQKGLTFDEVCQMQVKLKALRKIAMNRRNSRNSCEMFDKSEVIFQLDEQRLPINIGLKKRIESEKIVEEFMIMTNYEVAKKLVKDFGANSLVIYHPKPLDSNLEHLNGYVSDLGVKFKAVNMQHLEQEFKQLFEQS
jgi:exoribonuclease R